MGGKSRTEDARARARGAKLAIGAAAAVAFGASFLAARGYAPGHVKHRARPLGAPASFERSVRRSALEAGQIAPPVEPPAVVTSTS